MNVEEFNNTPQGRSMLAKVKALDDEITEILNEVRNTTTPASHGAWVEWDDDGFYEKGDV